MTLRVGILGSTRGTNLEYIHTALAREKIPAQIVLVISNKESAPILANANRLGLPSTFLSPAELTREAYDQQVTTLLQQHQVDVVLMMGYMRIVSDEFVQTWQDKLLNVHPSLLPAFAGLMDLDVHRAVLAAGVKKSGCTVHYVTSEVDAGPIILQKTCEVKPDDTPESLKQRVQQLEAIALVAAIQRFCTNSR